MIPAIADWFVYSIISMLLFGIVNFLLKIPRGSSDIIGTLMYFFASLTMFIIFLARREPLLISRRDIFLPLGMGILLGIAAFFLIKAVRYSENPGVAIAIVNLNTVITFLLALVFLKAGIKPINILGIILSIISIFLLSM